MDAQQYIESIRADSAGLLDAAAAADRSTAIAACPEWRVPDLVWHIGEVQHFWGTIVRDRMQDWQGYVEPTRPDTDQGLYAFAADSAEQLVAALSGADPATPVYTWAAQKDVAFVIRRMAQEVAVHRVDAERAAGRGHRVDPALASDGIDEFLELHLADEIAGSVHLHCIDVDGEWLVAPGADGAKMVTREHAKGDAAIRGPAHDLLMVLWRRQALDTVDVVGDRSVAEGFVARTDLD
jgi:uncharacterized protein (TIGR03083 family)